MTQQNLARHQSASKQPQTHWPRLLIKSPTKLVVLLASSMLAGCGTFADLVVAPQQTAKLSYLNPPRPSPVIPPKVELGSPIYWLNKNHPQSNLICTPSQDWVNIRVFYKEVAFWMKQANKTIDYHEKRNGPETLAILPK